MSPPFVGWLPPRRIEQPVGQIPGEGGAYENAIVPTGSVDRQQDDAGLAEHRLRGGALAEGPWMQIQRASLGQYISAVRAPQPQRGALSGNVDRGAAVRGNRLA